MSTVGPAPLIAVTTSELREHRVVVPTDQGEPPRQEMALGLTYLKAIEHAGGVPVVVPPIRDEVLLGSLLDRVSGVCLTGGPDLDPVAYGALRHEQIGPTWQVLDACELILARLADERHLPVLGICRGQQAINVARGGNLHQHLPDVAGDAIQHRQTAPGDEPTHDVALTGPSRLAEIMRCADARVNSFHHQAVAELGHGLVATSHAPDGTIESIEACDRDFLIGVQWHAECLTADETHAALFHAFVDAARRREASPELARRAA